MSFVYSLRITLFYAVVATVFLAMGAYAYVGGAPVEFWLVDVAVGAVLWFVLADGVQRRLRGDARTHTTEPDERTLVSAIVALAGLALVGLWSLASGHEPVTWIVLLGGGLVGVVGAVAKLRALRRE